MLSVTYFTITVEVRSLSFNAVKLTDILIDKCIACEFVLITMSKLAKSQTRKVSNTFYFWSLFSCNLYIKVPRVSETAHCITILHFIVCFIVSLNRLRLERYPDVQSRRVRTHLNKLK